MDAKSLVLSLPASHQAVFSALNCEKMLPSVAKFDEEELVPAINAFKKAVAGLYSFSLGQPIDLEAYQNLKDEIESFWPDLDESENDFASYAFDAFAAMTEALNFVLNRDSLHVTNCATAVLDTVDMYIQEASELEPPAAGLEDFIQASPFMKREVERQNILAHELAKISVIDTRAISYLKSLNEQQVLIDFTAL